MTTRVCDPALNNRTCARNGPIVKITLTEILDSMCQKLTVFKHISLILLIDDSEKILRVYTFRYISSKNAVVLLKLLRNNTTTKVILLRTPQRLLQHDRSTRLASPAAERVDHHSEKRMRRSSEWVCKYAQPIANRRLSGHVGPTALANSSITWGRLRAAPVFIQPISSAAWPTPSSPCRKAASIRPAWRCRSAIGGTPLWRG